MAKLFVVIIAASYFIFEVIKSFQVLVLSFRSILCGDLLYYLQPYQPGYTAPPRPHPDETTIEM